VPEINGNTLSERTLEGIREVMDRTLTHVNGLERSVVAGAVRALYPRIENRILVSPEEDLRTELVYVKELLDAILAEPVKQPVAGRGKRRRPSRKKR